MKTILIVGIIAALLPQSAAPTTGSTPRETILTSAVVEPLSSQFSLQLAPERAITLEPGIRAIRQGSQYCLTTHDGSNVELVSAGMRISLASPANLSLLENRWMASGMSLAGSTIIARRSVQDDTDSNLKSMQESAKKLKSKNTGNQENGQQPNKKLRVRWLYGENPNPTAELFNTPAIQQLTHTSPIGF